MKKVTLIAGAASLAAVAAVLCSAPAFADAREAAHDNEPGARFDSAVTSVSAPEPATLGLLALGLSGLGFVPLRRRRSKD
jgi:PEP-CTERM motif